MSQRRDPLGELRRFAQRHPPPYLLAVSGGRDSMALLEAAKRLGVQFDVVTVDHGMRKEANKETQLVQAQYERVRVVKLKPPVKPTLAWAREARYAALLKWAKKRLVLTAHHRDDWVETLLFQMLRGTSPDAWATFNRPGVARPFLGTARADLERFVAKHKVPYIDDPSNSDRAHPRTVIRETLIPLLNTLAPGDWQERVCRLATDVAADATYLSSLLPPLSKVLEVDDLPEPLQRRAAWRWLSHLSGGLQRHHVDATLALLGASNAAFVKLPDGLTVRRRGKSIKTP